MTKIDSVLGRALAVLALSMLVACGGSGTTEPLETVDVSGAWAGTVHARHSIEITLVQSTSGTVVGTGITRTIAPNPTKAGALDTVASPLKIEGSIQSSHAELEILDASGFNSFRDVRYRFKGTARANSMTGTLSIVQGSQLNFGPPHSPLPPENISFTWSRAL